jgi:hypothetical protein
MSRTLQFKRYGSLTLANTAGADGELIVDSTTKTLTLHDGTTLGGSRIASEVYVQSTGGIALAQAAYNKANTASANTVIIQGVNITQNVALTQTNQFSQGAYDKANSAYDFANTLSLNATIDQYARTTANTASNNITIIQGVDVSQNNRMTLIESVDVGQNANIILLQSGLNTANANTVYLQSGLNSANANIALLQGAMTTANSSINAAAQTVPQNSQITNYTLQASDAGKHIYYTQASNTTLYVPWSSNASFSNGTTIMIISRTSSSANVTVSPNTGVTMYLAGNTTSASRNVTTYGMATLIQVAANTWFINGTGVV